VFPEFDSLLALPICSFGARVPHSFRLGLVFPIVGFLGLVLPTLGFGFRLHFWDSCFPLLLFGARVPHSLFLSVSISHFWLWGSWSPIRSSWLRFLSSLLFGARVLQRLPFFGFLFACCMRNLLLCIFHLGPFFFCLLALLFTRYPRP
jgi:signal transduction histidine kinase